MMTSTKSKETSPSSSDDRNSSNTVGVSGRSNNTATSNLNVRNNDEEMRKLLQPSPSEQDVMNILLQYYYQEASENTMQKDTPAGSMNNPSIKIIRRLDSYDDCNYQIEMNHCMYLLKVTNGIESMDYFNNINNNKETISSSATSVIHLQHAIMNVLHQNDICTTIPIQPLRYPNDDQTMNSNSNSNSNSSTDPLLLVNVPVVCPQYSPYKCIVRLFTWVHGTPMSNIPARHISLHTLLHIGQQLGYINHALDQLLVTSDDTTTGTCIDKNIRIPAQRYHQWDGKHTYDLRHYIQYIPNEQRRNMIESILQSFASHFVSTASATSSTNTTTSLTAPFRTGIIMGDYNDANIILSNNNNNNNNPSHANPTSAAAEYRFAGVIDFGDSVESWRVLDVTIAMAYAMLSSYGKSNHSSISAAASVLRGYHSIYPLQDIEREHLVLLIACRLACSTTLGAFSIQQNPDNKYLLLHSEPAWQALELIWGYDIERRQQMKDALDLIFEQACNCNATGDANRKTEKNVDSSSELQCYDLFFPDPSVPDPLATIRGKDK